MSTFAAEWLALREGADVRARNRNLTQAVAAWFQLRDQIAVVDLGSGTGANLRAVAPLLPPKQSWLLIDKDEALLASAKLELRKWADTTELAGDTLKLTKGVAEIDVHFQFADLAHDLDRVLTKKPDLVTASCALAASRSNARGVLRNAYLQRRAALEPASPIRQPDGGGV
jgi:SAM-dependent methyltransferase